MEFAIEVAPGEDGIEVLVAEQGQAVTRHPVAVLTQRGLPKRRKDRVLFETSFSRWEVASPDVYFTALSIELPAHVEVKHRVYRVLTADGLEVMVPALALMQAFFRPQAKVLTAAFSALNIDTQAFVDFVEEVPVVRTLFGAGVFSTGHEDQGIDRYLKWLMTSRSGRICAQSAHTHALHGWLDLDLPQGDFRLGANGVKVGNQLFVTELSVQSVAIPADDNLTGQAEVFYLNGNTHVRVDLPSSVGAEPLTDTEWAALASACPPDADRALVGLVLQRLVQGYWSIAEPGQVAAAGHLLQKWCGRGALAKLVARFNGIRAGSFLMSPERMRLLRSTNAKKPALGSHDERIGPMNVFLDTEFATNAEGATQLLSIGLCTDGSEEFYAEAVLPDGPIGAGEFLEEEVFPQLGQPSAMRGSMLGIAQALTTWLDGLGQTELQVCYDFNLDYGFIEQLLSMLPMAPKTKLLPAHIGYLKEDAAGIRAAEACWGQLEAARGLHRHHALADCMALRAQFAAVHGTS